QQTKYSWQAFLLWVGFCLRNKLPDLLQILGVASVILVSPGCRIDPCRLHCHYGIGYIIRTQSAGDDNGNFHRRDHLAVDLPVMGYAKRTNLTVTRLMTV